MTSTTPKIDNWEVRGDKLIFTESCDIAVKGQIFEEGAIVEVDYDTVIRLGKPAKSGLPKTPLHTTRLINIFKMVLEDMDKTKEQFGTNPNQMDVFAYTSRNSIPNITRHDVEEMIKELNI